MTRTAPRDRPIKATSLGWAIVAAGALSSGVAASTRSNMDEQATPPPSAMERAYRAGQLAAEDSTAARAHFQRGIDLARARLRERPDAPEALLWLAANLAAEALTHGKLRALRAIPEIEQTLLRLEQLEPEYDHAAAARALGNLYWKAPSIISVGSSRRAEEYFGRALARAPTYPGNQALAAAFFSDRRDCARARPLAKAVISRDDLQAFGPDAPEWRRLALEVQRDCGGG